MTYYDRYYEGNDFAKREYCETDGRLSEEVIF